MKRPRWPGWLRWPLFSVAAFAALLFIFIFVEVAISWKCDLKARLDPPVPQPAERKAATAGIRDYARPEDDTYLSYPEWYIVWSYQEKADYQQYHLPSGFPYLGAIRQYWSSYCCISRLTRGKYAFNAGEQLMLVVIGTSFSAEYVLKGAYENTVGRLSELTSGGEPVEEDRYAYQVARDYADFVHVRPFYEFRFARRLTGLWAATPLWGAHLLRKWERKLFLSLDYSVEAFYCWMIEQATHLVYGVEPDRTYALVESDDEKPLQEAPRLNLVKQIGAGGFIADMPRYQEFTTVAGALARNKVRFIEIAGNSQITVSVLAPESWQYPNSDGQELFSMPLLTHPHVKRVIIGCKVGNLHSVLNALGNTEAVLEHVYDY